MAKAKSSIRVADLTGAEKAAAFCVSLGTDMAAAVMSKLEVSEVEQLTTAIARM